MGETGLGKGIAKSERSISGPAALKPAEEAPRVASSTIQWSLAATEDPALSPGALPPQAPSAR